MHPNLDKNTKQQFSKLSKVLAKTLEITESELFESFKPAKLEQLDQLCDIRVQVNGPEKHTNDYNYLKWRYFTRPGFDSCLWVFESSGEVIGAIGTEPVKVKCEDASVSAMRVMDIIVAPKYNGRGIGAWMNLYMQVNNVCVLACGGNKNSLSMLEKQFYPLPEKRYHRLIFKFQSLVSNKIKSKTLAFIISITLNSVWSFKKLLQRNRLGAIKKSVTIEKISSSENFIQKLPNSIGVLGRVKVHRDSEFIAWRYGKNPNHRFNYVCLHANNILVGFMISMKTKRNSATIGQILDWDLFDYTDLDLRLAYLFQVTAQWLKMQNVEYITMYLNDIVSKKAAQRIGFSTLKEETSFFIYCSDEYCFERMKYPKNWYHSYGDTDYF